jgi:hypothetical protein
MKTIPVEFTVGDRVWTYSDSGNREAKEIICPCCGGWTRFFFGAQNITEKRVTGIEVLISRGTCTIIYRLDDHSRCDSSMVFPTEEAAKAWAKEHYAKIDKDSLEQMKAFKLKIKKGIKKIRRAKVVG